MADKSIKFATILHLNKVGVEHNDGEVLVDTTCYVSPEEQILSFIRAGEVYQANRRYFYDFDDGQEEDFYDEDVTRRPGFDISDLGNITRDSRRNRVNNEEQAVTEPPQESTPSKQEDGQAITPT